jgi:outer membrane protein assembly factor BamA
MRTLLLVTLVSLVWGTPVRAQPESQTGSAAEPAAGAAASETPTAPAEPTAAEATDATLAPMKVDAASCAPLDLTPGALLSSATDEFALATPIPWSEFEIEGQLVDSNATVHALLAPTLAQYRTSLSLATMPELALVVARFGYQLIEHRSIELPHGARLVLHLAPLPLVRKVYVDMKQSILDKLLEDEVQRRMSIRTGSYLPWEPIRRGCALLDEQRRINEFLYDEGYYDASVKIVTAMDVAEASLRVKVDLGNKYTLGKVTIACPSGTERRKGKCVDAVTGAPYVLAVSEQDVKDAFELQANCLIGPFVCIGKPRFTRSQFQQDIQDLKKAFQTRGYPSVRIITSDPRLSFNRKDRAVDIVVTIDQRRHIDVQFEGYDPDAITEEQLREQLTFNEAGSADEVEIGASASQLTTYLQTRGFFDAHVTSTRERIDTEPRPNTHDAGVHLDRIVFRFSMGQRRRVARVSFVGNRAIPTSDLEALVATKEAGISGTIFGTTLAATSTELIIDQDRIKEAYRRIGYPDVRVWPSASPTPLGLGSAALTAALLGVDTGSDLFVRFTIEEGEPTLVSRVVVVGEDGEPVEAGLCAQVLGELATLLGDRDVAARVGRECAATVRDLLFRSDDVSATRDQLRDYLYREGRARSVVQYQAIPIGPHRIEARYTIDRAERLKLGKVVIRGNFRTAQSVIYDVLDFEEGQLLTTDRLADGARKLRNTGLFEAVNIDMPELDCDQLQRSCSSEVINAVVRVEERYDHLLGIQLEGGYSSLNGLFGTARVVQRNVAGRGISLSLSGTKGTKLTEAEAQLRVPKWLSDRVPIVPEFTTVVTGLYRKQDTERFGILTTQGVTAEFPWEKSVPRTDDHSARVYQIAPSYAFRVRSRNVDAFRPIGADMDEAQVAVSTRTGALGIGATWEQRVDRNGQLAPLSPEDGFRLEGSVAFASPYLFGQDTFIKASASASKFIPIGKNLVLRADLRYDHGIPLGGAVMLPDVERFFAGGDNTVRGYPDERLKTEVIQVGLPPLDNVSQIRVIPAGGNIRVLGSVDAQVRIWKIVAGAMFADAGLITNRWDTVEVNRKWGFVPDIPDLRPSVGMGLRFLTPFGIGALEYAVPLRPQLGDDPRGRIHFYFAARAQF